MKILSARQIREWDNESIRRQGISSLSLMERAATSCTNWLVAHYPVSTPFLVLCGSGNNGGDGLAITRLLLAKGYAASALLLPAGNGLSADCTANLEALKMVSGKACDILGEGQFITSLPPEIVLIDAIFGTGLNRQLAGYVAEFVQRLHVFPNEKVAIDIPSGLLADELPIVNSQIVVATHTLTFQQYKRAMLHPEAARFCGHIHRVDIGLDPDFLALASSNWHTLEAADVRKIFKPRNRFAHKGDLGLAFIVAGSFGMMGASVLATRAAGRAGAGKVLGLIPRIGYEIFQTCIPEAMCITGGEEYLEEIVGWESAQGIGIGPGLGRNAKTAAALKDFLKKAGLPVVLDADALNILSENKSWLKHIPKQSILTPHPKEFSRLFGTPENSFARAGLTRSLAMKNHWTLIAKDAHSLLALPDGNCYFVVNGSPGMATAGSGDVLLGMITGLLAQGYESEDAALLAAYLHAAAGSFAASQLGVESMLAGDIISHIGAAFSILQAV